MIHVHATDHPAGLARILRDDVLGGHDVEMYALGAVAVNQAVKAIAAARGMLVTHGVEIAFQPSLAEADSDWNAATGLRLLVRRR